MEGVVLRSTGSWYDVRTDGGVNYSCKLRGVFRTKGIRNTNPVAVGDRVVFSVEKDGNGIITDIEPRKNYIIRKATKLSKQSHIIAANIDMAMLVATVASPRTSTGFIDRFLVTAEAYGIKSVIVFNKSDLYDEDENLILERLKSVYEGCGYECIVCSALTGYNIDVVRDYLKGKKTLLSGHSGVGKSALINAVEPDLEVKTGEISKVHDKGKHTTTYAMMYPLSFGGYIIDTPGIKEFGLILMDKYEISHYFPEMFDLLPQCQYGNCSHIHEPGCAVKKALEDGTVSRSRYDNYLNMVLSVED